ncbi:hypothetical protein N7495_001222 [Penicillium taxi]|uniref:uncharacterized protein n=1 Tax=Penicillium taxi TaxID=168475 RepID=UPI002544D99C|nr:uncharacterized protein N7495_001222 [Penicillium taxi]KAJ5908540.1 hypothetical protein N7495_001222 [Penicillium taxi]
MDQSLTLINAQVNFVEERLALVHIPLELYPFFFKSVLGLIYDETSHRENEAEDMKDDGSKVDEYSGSYQQPAFLNISITPVEVSVICPRRLVEKHFVPAIHEINQLNAQLPFEIVVSANDYIAMQVLGEGLEAGKRVLELTSPLAMAGISIFFISTYFSDYILVPLRSKASVVSALENRGFQFQNATTAFVNPTSPLSPRTEKPLSDLIPPLTPPPSTVSELQTRTFANLRNRQIFPIVDDTIHLVQCAAHHPYNCQQSSMSILREALATILLVDNPRFLSLTLADLDPAASLLLEKRLLPRFARPGEDFEDGSGLLLGSKEDHLIPIILDLRELPLEASGIVCGVAGRLAEATDNHSRPSNDVPESKVMSSVINSVPALFDTVGTRLARGFEKRRRSSVHKPPATHHLKPEVDPSADAVEISFLSTARAGTIIVGEDELQRAIDALEAEKRQDSPAVEDTDHNV